MKSYSVSAVCHRFPWKSRLKGNHKLSFSYFCKIDAERTSHSLRWERHDRRARPAVSGRWLYELEAARASVIEEARNGHRLKQPALKCSRFPNIRSTQITCHTDLHTSVASVMYTSLSNRCSESGLIAFEELTRLRDGEAWAVRTSGAAATAVASALMTALGVG